MATLVAGSGDKRTAITESSLPSSIYCKLPKMENVSLADTLIKTTNTTASFTNVEATSLLFSSGTNMSTSFDGPNSEKSDEQFDPFESIQDWLNRELGEKPSPANPEIRSDSPIFDDWDDITYDSDDDEEYDFLQTVQSPRSFDDAQSIPGSEGYGTDTSDLNESLINLLHNNQSDSAKPKLPTNFSESEGEKPVDNISTTSVKKGTISFTSGQTIATSKTQSELVKPRIITLKENSFQANIPKGAKITRVYQIPKLNNAVTQPTVSSKVGTQTRKTVVVKVLKPKKGFIRVKKPESIMSGTRANLKMQLQRDQIIYEEKLSQKKDGFTTARSVGRTAVNVPNQAVQRPSVPSQVLKVETELQNPTRYHVRETQRTQAKEFLSQSHDGSRYVIRQILAPQSSAPSAGGAEAFQSSTPASPLARLKISSSVDNLGNDVYDVIEDITSFESSLGEEHRTAKTLSTVSPHALSRFSTDASGKLPVIIRENVSSSCPVIKRELTEDDIHLFSKDRIKKDNHNIIERRRRYNINDRIKELGYMVPKPLDPDTKWNKGSILKATVDYIRSVQNEQNHYRQVEQRNRELEALNKKLVVRVQELQASLQQNGINVVSDAEETQNIVDILINLEKPESTNNTSSFTQEEEQIVRSFPSNVVFPDVMVTQPQTAMQEDVSNSFSSANVSVSLPFQLSPRNSFQSQQLLTTDISALSPQQQQQIQQPQQMQQQQQQVHQQQQQQQQQQVQQQQHLSPNTSFSQFIYSPLSSNDSVTSPNQVSPQQQTTEANVNVGIEGLPDMDISSFNYDNSSNFNIDGGFTSLLTDSSTNVFDDVMMTDDLPVIKTDLFLSDAVQPPTTHNDH